MRLDNHLPPPGIAVLSKVRIDDGGVADATMRGQRPIDALALRIIRSDGTGLCLWARQGKRRVARTEISFELSFGRRSVSSPGCASEAIQGELGVTEVESKRGRKGREVLEVR